MPQICEALQFAHNEGIVHRDVSRRTFCFDAKGRVKIADFGIAKIIGPQPDQIAPHGRERRYRHAPPLRPRNNWNARKAWITARTFFRWAWCFTNSSPANSCSAVLHHLAKGSVDVRLDEVVFWIGEESQQWRYQQAGQVKTAVDHMPLAAPGLWAPPPPAAMPLNKPKPRAENQLALAASGDHGLFLALGAVAIFGENAARPIAPAPTTASQNIPPRKNPEPATPSPENHRPQLAPTPPPSNN